MSKQHEYVRRAALKGYIVDTQGRVWSPKGKCRKCWIGSQGYPEFSVLDDITGKVRSIDVHRLAAFQWFGEAAFRPGVEVRHRDANRTNAARSNLRLGTRLENIMDVPPAQRWLHARTAAKVLRKLTESEVAALRRDRAKGMTLVELGAKYGGLAKSTVSYIVNEHTYVRVAKR